MSDERLEQWIRDQAPQLARQFREREGALAVDVLRKLEAEDELSEEAWKAHFEETFGFKPTV